MSSPAKEAGIADRLNDSGKVAIQPAAYTHHRAGTSALSANSEETISLIRYAPGILLVVIAIVAAGQQVDPDLWGHFVSDRRFLLSITWCFRIPTIFGARPFVAKSRMVDRSANGVAIQSFRGYRT